MNISNIIELNKRFHAFQGYRVNIRRQGRSFVRYFSALECKGMEKARQEAERMRDSILRELERTPDDPEAVFARFRKPAPCLPPGLHPMRKPLEGAPSTCTLRCTGKSAAVLNLVCERLGVDRASALRLALYALAALLGQKEYANLSLRQLVAQLESLGFGLPDWTAYATGRREGEDS